MNNILTYRCEITGYIIQFIVNTDKVAIMDTVYCDFQYMSSLFLLIKRATQDLEEKKITKIYQRVTYEDYHDFLKNKTTWKIAEEDTLTSTLIIESTIEDFLKNFLIGHGITV